MGAFRPPPIGQHVRIAIFVGIVSMVALRRKCTLQSLEDDPFTTS